MEPIIKIKNLTVIYEKGAQSEVRALDNVSFEIYPEEYIIFFGPSGCGKSTLLYVIAGIERQIEKNGEIWVKDRNLVEFSKEDLVNFHRKEIGMIFQAYNLIPTLDVLNNVALPLIFSGAPKTEREQKAKALISRFDISAQAERLPQLLSGGQQQRVGIARALVTNPDIILADEPVGNLDSQSALTVLQTLRKLNKEDKKTLILVTHEAQYLTQADRIFYMKDGKIIRIEKQKSEPYSIKHPEEEKKEAPLLLPAALTVSSRKKINTSALLDYFGQQFNVEEILRFEDILDKFISQKLSQREFEILLDKPFKDGGLGVYHQTAKKLAREIEKILQLSNALKKDLEEKKELSFEIEKIAIWLLDEYAGKILSLQEERIEDGILKRIKKEYGRKDFENFLDRPTKNGGAGLNWRTAKNLAAKLEVIIQ